MDSLKVGDIVTRKSYGGDIHFKIADIASRSSGRRTYVLKGMLFRIIADSDEDDLELEARIWYARNLLEAYRRQVCIIRLLQIRF
jgi:spore coat assembly protein